MTDMLLKNFPSGNSEPRETRVLVRGSCPLNDTAVKVLPGATFRITAGEPEAWADWYIGSTAEGWKPEERNLFARILDQLFGWARRVPDGEWYALAVQVGDGPDAPRALVGNGAECQSEVGGEIFLFANDVPFAYWNNRGVLPAYVQVASALALAQEVQPSSETEACRGP
jgi:hypothetical protein